MGIEIQSTYKIRDSMSIVAGAVYEKQKVWDGQFWYNILETDTPEVFIQLPALQKVWEDEPGELKYVAFFLEDIWDITQKMRLTSGLRYDEYFGAEGAAERYDLTGHFSPRVGFTWEYTKGYDLKLLYGHAFLIPSLNDVNNSVPGATLDPQIVDTYEVSLGADFTPSISGRITLYYRDEDDVIEGTPFGFVNSGKVRSKGVEVEAKYDFGRGTYLAGNFTYSSWTNDDDTPYPRYLGKIMSNIRFSRHLNFYADCYHAAGMSRQPGDLRDDTSSYTIVNATLIAKKFLKDYEGFELRGSVYNLFDEDWSRYVSENMPYGWPKPGINFLLEMKYSF